MTTRVWGVSVGVPYYGFKKMLFSSPNSWWRQSECTLGHCLRQAYTHTHTELSCSMCTRGASTLSFFSNSLSSLSRFSLKHQHDTRLTPWSECQDLATHAFCHALVCWFKQKVRRGFPHPTAGSVPRNTILRVASDVYSMNCIYWL